MKPEAFIFNQTFNISSQKTIVLCFLLFSFFPQTMPRFISLSNSACTHDVH